MSDVDNIAAYLIEYGLVLSASIIQNPLDESSYYVFVQKNISDRGAEEPTRAAIERMRGQLQSKGHHVEFILTGGSYRDAEAGVRALVTSILPELVEGCFISVEGRTATIWVTPKRSLQQDEHQVLNESCSTYIRSLKLIYGGINFTPSDNHPSKLVCLKIIRTHAPVCLDQIISLARAKAFDVPSAEWMSKNLDNMRKSGQVIRLKNGAYALTLDALKSLGTAKDASSPDIARLLDLARRGG